MIVWRVQNIAGYGPYYHGDKLAFNVAACKIQRETSCNPYTHPGPRDDPKLMGLRGADGDFDKRFIFGFATLGQYRQWFYTAGARRILRQEGFKLYCYSIRDEMAIRTMVQCVFRRGYGKLISERECDYV